MNGLNENNMTIDERGILIDERTEIESRLKGDFADPKDFRRLSEIASLLLTDGDFDNITFKVSKQRKSQRVTSFTKDRR